MLTGEDARDLGIQLRDVDDFAGVFLLDVGGDGDVVVVRGDVLVRYELGDMGPRPFEWWSFASLR